MGKLNGNQFIPLRSIIRVGTLPVKAPHKKAPVVFTLPGLVVLESWI